MAERIRRERTTHAVEQVETTELTTPRAATIDYDALLDEIDEVLQLSLIHISEPTRRTPI